MLSDLRIDLLTMFAHQLLNLSRGSLLNDRILGRAHSREQQAFATIFDVAHREGGGFTRVDSRAQCGTSEDWSVDATDAEALQNDFLNSRDGRAVELAAEEQAETNEQQSHGDTAFS